jgi:hypothetical protein
LADSSAARRTNRPPAEVAEPEGEDGGGERDHPGAPSLARRDDGDEREPDRERQEEEAERAPVHVAEGSADGGYTRLRSRGE